MVRHIGGAVDTLIILPITVSEMYTDEKYIDEMKNGEMGEDETHDVHAVPVHGDRWQIAMMLQCLRWSFFVLECLQ